MPLPSSGALSMSQIRNEFGGSNPVSLSQYYRDGGLVPSSVANIEPTSADTTNVVTSSGQRFFFRYITGNSAGEYHALVIEFGGGGDFHWFFQIIWDGTVIDSAFVPFSVWGSISDVPTTAGPGGVYGSSTYFREIGNTFGQSPPDGPRYYEEADPSIPTFNTWAWGIRRETGTVTVNSGVPTSGTIKISDFYGAKKTL